MPPKKNEKKEVNIIAVERGSFEACLLGRTPIILNRLASKAKQELLYPKKKTAADRQAYLKHEPLHEFLESPYRDSSGEGPTVLQVKACSVKLAAASIALDLPDCGTSKAQLSRLIFAPADRVPLYGIPEMLMSVVRTAGINRTPDIRTRAIVPKWACKVELTYVKPVLQYEQVVNLVAAAGFMRGIGDWRPEKGNGNFGEFELVAPDDPRFLDIVKNGGREAQEKALNAEMPIFYDDETEDLYTWFLQERERRKQGGKKGNGAQVVVEDDDTDIDGEETYA